VRRAQRDGYDTLIVTVDTAWLRTVCDGPLVVKGIQCVDDTVILAEVGADAVVLSTHGGRQVDMGNVPLELLPEVVSAIGDRLEVHVDGRIMTGADVVAVLAMGARGTLIGRAYLYGLMAGGYHGVVGVLDILDREIRAIMQLIGAPTTSELTEEVIRFRDG